MAEEQVTSNCEMAKTIPMRDVPDKVLDKKKRKSPHGLRDALATSPPLFADYENPVFDGPRKQPHKLKLNTEADE